MNDNSRKDTKPQRTTEAVFLCVYATSCDPLYFSSVPRSKVGPVSLIDEVRQRQLRFRNGMNDNSRKDAKPQRTAEAVFLCVLAPLRDWFLIAWLAGSHPDLRNRIATDAQ